MDKILLYFSLKYHSDWDKVYEALERKEKVNPDEVAKIEKSLKCKYITILDPRYPNNLRMSYRPPFVLFYRGNIKLLLAYYKTIGILFDQEGNVDSEKIKTICDEVIENRFLLLLEDDSKAAKIVQSEAVLKETQMISITKKPILEAFEDNLEIINFAAKGNLVLSESYDKTVYDECEERGFLLRLFAGLTNNSVFLEGKYQLAWDQLIAYMQNNGNNVFAISNDETTTKKLTRRGVVLVEKLSEVFDTI